MPDLSRLESLIARLAGIDFSQSSEQDTREIAVNTIIGELGWDTLDRNEVAREYSVRGGRVDYCLRSQTRNLVLIEVKRAGTDLAEHQEQLLRYAFDEGVPLAALTDGLVWWLYLPTAGASWEQRRFYRVHFREERFTDTAGALHRFLNRDGVISGEAQEEAKREFESQERDRRARAALQQAWQQVLSDPNSLFREELADAAEEISGYRPYREAVSDFLQGMSGNAKTEDRPIAPLTVSAIPDQNSMSDASSSPGTLPSALKKREAPSRIKRRSSPPLAFWLRNERHELRTQSWRGLLIQLCECLARESGQFFVERASQLRGRERPHFSLLRTELREPIQIPGTALYFEGNVSAKGAEQMARRTVTAILGSDDGFRIDIRPAPRDS